MFRMHCLVTENRYMFVIVLKLLRHPLNTSETNNMQIMSLLPGFYFGLIMRPHTVSCQDSGFDFSFCSVY